MKRIFIFAIFLITLVAVLLGCSSPIPATPAPVDLSSLKLEPILIQSGDLPAGLNSGEISYNSIQTLLQNDISVPTPQNQIVQLLVSGGTTKGFIWLVLYDSESYVKLLYEDLIYGFVQSNVSKLNLNNGVEMTLSNSSGYFDLAFYKCNYVGYLRTPLNDKFEATNYIERLSKRLDKILNCK